MTKAEILYWLEGLIETFDDGFVVWTTYDQIQLIKLREDVADEVRSE